MKNFLFSMSIFLFISCNKKGDDLKVIILNDSINCISNFDHHLLYHKSKEFDAKYFEKSLTVINYKIQNNSDKKYFIVLNSNYFNNKDLYIDEISKKRRSYANCNSLDLLNNGKSIMNGFAEYFEDSNYNYNNPIPFVKYIFINDSLNHYKCKYLYGSTDLNKSKSITEINNNHIVIYPHESKYFSTIVNLPVMDYKLRNNSWAYFIVEKGNYEAQISIANLKSTTSSDLTENLKKEINENGYTIFDGVIHSNKVPVKMISMP